MSDKTLLIGHVMTYENDPFLAGIEAVQINSQGGILIQNGMIAAVGDAATLRASHPDAHEITHKDDLLMPGFVDAHVHYAQTAMVASWGKRLIDWLNSYTFPEESRFAAPDYGTKIANRYLDLALLHGTTSMTSFCTIHPASVDALFEAAEARGMHVTAGRTAMDRNAPESLRDISAQQSYDESKALLSKWHGKGRASYAVSPRFTPTSTPEQLELMGALWAEHPDCAMQTHLSEQTEEIAWVKSLCPEARDYLDTYERVGLIGPGALMGHAIHLTEREISTMAATQTGVVHCPTSNTFIGSGLCDLRGLKARGIPVGLGTDTGGGSSFSMLRTMAATYEIGQLRGTALHAAELLWLATAGSAEAMRQSHRIGRIAPGLDADIIALNLHSTAAITQRAKEANTIWEAIFPTIMMGDDRAIRETYIMGRPSRPYME